MSTVLTYRLSNSTHSPVPLLHATADDIPEKKTEKRKTLNYLEACFQVLSTINGQEANAIKVNVQIYVLSHIADNFQGVAEMVSDHLPKSSKVDFATELN